MANSKIYIVCATRALAMTLIFICYYGAVESTLPDVSESEQEGTSLTMMGTVCFLATLLEIFHCWGLVNEGFRRNIVLQLCIYSQLAALLSCRIFTSYGPHVDFIIYLAMVPVAWSIYSSISLYRNLGNEMQKLRVKK